MSTPNKSFFSGLHLLVTGIAALTTTVVAVVGLAINQGWLNGNSRSVTSPGAMTSPTAGGVNGGTSSSTTGGASGGTNSGAGGGASATTAFGAVAQYTVDPTSIVFQSLGPTTQSVTLSNIGVAPLTVEPPTVTGPDAGQFSITDQNCGGSVDAGRSCSIQVSFKHAPGNFSATVVVRVTGASQATAIPIKATAIL